MYLRCISEGKAAASCDASAVLQVKDVALVMVANNDNDGVAEAIERFVL
jgi:hypothetical protein